MLVSAPILPNVRKIAVARVNALGDFLFTVPALEALRAAYPQAEIVLLGKAWHASFLARRTTPIDRVVVVPPCRGVGADPDIEENPAELERFFQSMVQERFDLAIQMHGGGRYSNPFTRRLGARVTIGLQTPDALPLDYTMPYIYYQHEIVRYLELVALVGATTSVLEPHIAVHQDDLAESARLVPYDDRPLVALHPGASDPKRRWSPDRFAVVGNALVEAGARVVITGIAEERELTAAVMQHMEGKAQDLGGMLSLGGLTGLLTRCRVLVANDTGPLHLASAVGTATVGVYWCNNLIIAGPMMQTWHRTAVSWQVACPVCGVDQLRTRCEHPDSLVDVVCIQDVLAPALAFLLER